MKEADRVVDSNPDSRPASAYAPWCRYLGAVVGGLLAALSVFVSIFALLEATDRLPPPPIANNLCLDEKLAFMRDNPPENPNLLVVGSSVAWRHIDSGVLADRLPGTRPFNGGLCGLNIAQTEAVTPWLLSRMPAVENVVFLASTEDFEICERLPRTTFDIGDADRFVFQRSWRWGFYFRYFDPVSLVRNAVSIRRMRSAMDKESLVMNKYGDSPMHGEFRGLIYDGIQQFDGTCFQALRTMAQDLQSAGLHLTVVNTPLYPRWSELYDRDGALRAELNARIGQALKGTGAHHWNGDAEFVRGPDVFLDAIHLRWSAAQEFTALLAENLPQRAVLFRPKK